MATVTNYYYFVDDYMTCDNIEHVYRKEENPDLVKNDDGSEVTIIIADSTNDRFNDKSLEQPSVVYDRVVGEIDVRLTRDEVIDIAKYLGITADELAN